MKPRKIDTAPESSWQDLPEFGSDTQVAQRYGVSRATVWRWAAEGRIPKPIKIAPGTTRWRLSGVVSALEGAQ